MPSQMADPALSISNLRFRYAPTGDWTIDVRSLELAPAEQVLLVGRSGRGKSTLLTLLAGLREPDEGEVRVHGRNIHKLSGAARDRYRGTHIGMIFQTFNLLHGFSALENVMAALMFTGVKRKEHADRAHGALDELGIDRPNAPVDQLSIGQQQRVAVARAVVAGPTVVLADEPTASLDPEAARTSMDLIQGACSRHNAALLLVSHDPSMRSRFERWHDLADLCAQPAGTGAGGEG